MNGFDLAEPIDGIAVLTIDMPGKVNTMSAAFWQELAETLDAVEQAAATDGPQAIKGLLIRSGKERQFLAGADLREVDALTAADPAAIDAFARRGQELLLRLAELPVSTAALIAGPALGGGLELALACHLRVAAGWNFTKIALPEVKMALMPAWGGTQRLPRLVGVDRAGELIGKGMTLDADAGFDLHLFDLVEPAPDKAEAAAMACLQAEVASGAWRVSRQKLADVRPSELFDAICRPSRDAHEPAAEAAVRAINEGGQLPLRQGLAIERREAAAVFGTAAAHERISAFLNRPK